MYMRGRLLAVLVVAVACADDTVTDPPAGDRELVSLVNGFGANIEMLVDGSVRAPNVAVGDITPIEIDVGARTLAVREAGSSATSSLNLQLVAGSPVALAALRGAGGSLSLKALEDSNAVVPAGATKLRVLHLAARSGEVQVWRTQPDYQIPIRWAFPFTYNSVNTYYQSTPGTWEVRVWTDSSSSWTSAQNSARVTLSGGGKKTVAILDRPGGGVRLQVID
jgi:hypothetical protein